MTILSLLSSTSLSALLAGLACLLAGFAVALIVRERAARSLETRVLSTAHGGGKYEATPDTTLTRTRPLARGREAAAREGMADALDLLALCSETGMGLEDALCYVRDAMREADPAVSTAFATLLQGMLVLPDRREALRDFAGRAGSDSARRLAALLARSMRYGIPLDQAPRALAPILRRERIAVLDVNAARLPVLLLAVSVVCILPATIMMLAGPSLTRMADTSQSGIRHADAP